MSSNTKEFDIAYKWLTDNIDDRFWDIGIAQKLEALLIAASESLLKATPPDAERAAPPSESERKERVVVARKILSDSPE